MTKFEERKEIDNKYKKLNDKLAKRGENQPSEERLAQQEQNDYSKMSYEELGAKRNSMRDAGEDTSTIQKEINSRPEAKAEIEARKTPKEEATTVETPKEEAETEEATTEEVEETPKVETPKEATSFINKINETSADDEDTGKLNSAIEANDATQLGDITDDEGNRILGGSFDKEGRYVPKVRNANECSKFLSKEGNAIAATAISAAITAIAASFGLPFPFHNFVKERHENEKDYTKALNEVEENYATLINDPIKAAEELTKTREAGREQNVEDVEAASKYSNEDFQKGAQLNAVGAGTDTASSVAKTQNSYDKWKTQFDADTQKWLKNKDAELAQWLSNADSEQQVKMAKLLNDQNNQRIIDQIEYGKAHGYSEDKMAQLVKKLSGITNVDAVMDNIGKGANVLTSIANSVAGFIPGKGGDGTSDKRVKKFDAKSANTNMFRRRK